MKLNYSHIIENFKDFFKNNYESYIYTLIEEINNSDNFVELSIYTSKAAEKPKQVVQEFMTENNLKNHSVTNHLSSFELNFSLLLEMQVIDYERQLGLLLFETIMAHNMRFN